MPALAAGATFAATTLAGLLLGLWIAARTGQPLWTLGGLALGIGFGGYSAFRLLMRSL